MEYTNVTSVGTAEEQNLLTDESDSKLLEASKTAVFLSEGPSGPVPSNIDVGISESLSRIHGRPSGVLAARHITLDDDQNPQSWANVHKATDTDHVHGRILYQQRFPVSLTSLYSIRYSQQGDFLATAFGCGAIQIRCGQTGNLRSTLRSGLENSHPVMCLRFHPIQLENFYASTADGNVFLCSITHVDFTHFCEEPGNQVNSFDLNSTGDILVTGGKDTAIRIYDTTTQQLITTHYKNPLQTRDAVIQKYHSMRVFAVRFHPDRKDMYLTGGWDNQVKIWDLREEGGCVRSIKGPHICGDALDIRDNTVLTGSWVVANSLQTWDINTTKLIETIRPINRPSSLNGEFLYATTYLNGDPTSDLVLIGGSGLTSMEVISIKERKVMSSLVAKKTVQAIDSFDRYIAYGGIEPMIRVAIFQ